MKTTKPGGSDTLSRLWLTINGEVAAGRVFSGTAAGPARRNAATTAWASRHKVDALMEMTFHDLCGWVSITMSRGRGKSSRSRVAADE